MSELIKFSIEAFVTMSFFAAGFVAVVFLVALIVGAALKFLPAERKSEDETDLMIFHGEDRKIVPTKSIHEGEDHDC